VQVSTVSNFATTLINQASLGVSTYTVPGAMLAWNTMYYWRASATNSSGSTSAWSAMRSFKTATGPPPNAPSSLVATAVSSKQINLTWTDNSVGETGFKVEKRTATGAYAQVATVGPDVHSYSSATGLAANTQYFYRVRSYFGTLNSIYSNEDDAWTMPPPPPVPTLLHPPAAAVGVTLPTYLDWNDSVGASTYGVQISTSSTFTAPITHTGLGTSIYTVPLGVLSANTTYYWRANAAGPSGSASAWSAMRSFKTAP
jgi:hypothetical protein